MRIMKAAVPAPGQPVQPVMPIGAVGRAGRQSDGGAKPEITQCCAEGIKGAQDRITEDDGTSEPVEKCWCLIELEVQVAHEHRCDDQGQDGTNEVEEECPGVNVPRFEKFDEQHEHPKPQENIAGHPGHIQPGEMHHDHVRDEHQRQGYPFEGRHVASLSFDRHGFGHG